MIVIFTLLFATGLLWALYWGAVRPVLIDNVEREREALRSKMEWAIIEGWAGSQTRAAEHLAQHLKTSLRMASLSPVLYLIIRHRAEVRATADQNRRIYSEAAPWVREILERHRRLSLKAVVVNSPTWWAPLAIVLLTATVSFQVAAWLGTIEQVIDSQPGLAHA